MSDNQSRLTRFDAGQQTPVTGDRYLPLRLWESDNLSNERVRDALREWGIDPADIVVDPRENLPEEKQEALYRWQWDVVYIFPRRVGQNEMTYEPVEFRTYIVTVGPPPNQIKRYIRRHLNSRLQYLFNSGPYEGHMNGFNFVERTTNTEADYIDPDEANNVGIPQWEVLITKGGSVAGEASGFADPFLLKSTDVPEPPQQTEWDVSWNPSRGDYQLSPPGETKQRERIKRLRGKEVYVNGAKVGSVTTDGRVWLKKKYGTKNEKWGDYHSREWLVENTGATYSAIREGGKVYKTAETGEAVYLSTAQEKPDDFEAEDPDEVDVEAVGEAFVITAATEGDEAVDFDIRVDRGPLLGRYNTPTQREIYRGDTFTIY